MKHLLDIKTAGKPLVEADKALIMIHGRGADAAGILQMASHLNVSDYALLAPQATQHTWYPYSFMAPAEQNEPWLSSSLENIRETVQWATDNGIAAEHIYFFGFSQGACLALEYLARNAQKYGGAAAIIGGVIGEEINRIHYTGNFRETPVFIGTSNPDFHVPVKRVYDTEEILRDMNADVTVKVYDGFGHSIHPEQITIANKLIFK